MLMIWWSEHLVMGVDNILKLKEIIKAQYGTMDKLISEVKNELLIKQRILEY